LNFVLFQLLHNSKEQEKHGMPQAVVVVNTTTFIKPRNKEKSVVSLPMVEHRSKEIDPNVVNLH
jgi:hypothetical protein